MKDKTKINIVWLVIGTLAIATLCIATTTISDDGSSYDADVTIDGADILLVGSTSDIESDVEIDFYPSSSIKSLRLIESAGEINILVNGGDTLIIDDNLVITSGNTLSSSDTSLIIDDDLLVNGQIKSNSNIKLSPNNLTSYLNLWNNGGSMIMDVEGEDYMFFNDDLVITNGHGLSSSGSYLLIEDELIVSSIASDGTGKVVCIKSDGMLGTCSDAPNVSGACTCS